MLEVMTFNIWNGLIIEIGSFFLLILPFGLAFFLEAQDIYDKIGKHHEK